MKISKSSPPEHVTYTHDDFDIFMRREREGKALFFGSQKEEVKILLLVPFQLDFRCSPRLNKNIFSSSLPYASHSHLYTQFSGNFMRFLLAAKKASHSYE